jgi:hypothetical protein
LIGLCLTIDREPGWRGKARFGLLAINAVLLATLILMHKSLGIRLDSGEDLPAFRSFHEVYLTVWTGQWLAILGLMVLDALRPIPAGSSDSQL